MHALMRCIKVIAGQSLSESKTITYWSTAEVSETNPLYLPWRVSHFDGADRTIIQDSVGAMVFGSYGGTREEAANLICSQMNKLQKQDDTSEFYRYVFRGTEEKGIKNFNRSNEWAIVTLDSKGMFTAFSDYGHYMYHWGMGLGEQDFREFLLTCDADYVLGKISPGKEADIEATKKAIKIAIFEHFKRSQGSRGFYQNDISKKFDLEWRRLELAKVEQIHSKEDLRYYAESGCSFPIDSDVGRMQEPFHTQCFVNYILPRLKEAIREQLANERDKTPAQV